MLVVERVEKSFGAQTVLRQVSFTVPAGSVTVLLGPSGCGKTTLLRVIAGLETPEAGRVLLHGQDLAFVPSHRRGLGLVFQDYALFPHMTVAQNVAFGLRMAGWGPDRITRRVAEALTWVGLAEFGARDVDELSGGERQRIALARSLAPAPRLLLLDEPMGALDRALRERLLGELRGILTAAGTAMGYESGITAVYVTHDQGEAFALADQVVVMDHGAVIQSGTPQGLHNAPASAVVARFLGMTNVLEGRLKTQAPPIVETELGAIRVSGADGHRVGDRLTILLRPDAASIAATHAGAPDLSGIVAGRTFRGRYQTLRVRFAAGETLRFELTPDLELPDVGEPINLWLNPARIVPLDGAADGGGPWPNA